jgi:hypothetical protein
MEKDKKTPQDRIIILNKEISMVAYKLLQSRIFPAESKAMRADAILELGDAMVQIEMLCYDLKIQPADVLAQGIQHTFERFTDFENRGWGIKTPPGDAGPDGIGNDIIGPGNDITGVVIPVTQTSCKEYP